MYSILIRPLQIEDAAISYEWRNDAEVWSQTGNKPNRLITLEIEEKWIQGVLADKTTKRFAITVDNKYIGNVQLTNISNTDAEFHIFIGEKEYWGRGIAQEATYQILYYAREVLKLELVYLFVKSSNLPAIKVYQKNSFVFDVDAENNFLKMICNLITLSAPMVSIFCMVYNHEQYVAEAIEGFLMQKTNFSSVIVIGEDCSKDKSREILLQYAERFPGKFKLLLHNTNVGAVKNQELVLENCNGKYIALCEGDDYWTNSLKLQKQVDFLEKNTDYGLVHTKYELLDEKTNSVKIHEIKKVDADSFRNYALTGDMRTMTVLFRSALLLHINDLMKQDFMQNAPIGDRALFLYIGTQAKMAYLDEVTGVYRLVAQNSASRFNQMGKYFSFLKKVCQLNIDLFLYLKLTDFDDYLKQQNKRKNFYETLEAYCDKKWIRFFNGIWIKTIQLDWKKQDVLDFWAVFK